MSASVLLVHDDLGTIASVRRLLARGEFEFRLVTLVTEAESVLGRQPPDVVLVSPQVDAGRGDRLIRQLAGSESPRVIALGHDGGVAGVRVVPMPLDGLVLLEALSASTRTPDPVEARDDPGPAGADFQNESVDLPILKTDAGTPDEDPALSRRTERGPATPLSVVLAEADWALAALKPAEASAAADPVEALEVTGRYGERGAEDRREPPADGPESWFADDDAPPGPVRDDVSDGTEADLSAPSDEVDAGGLARDDADEPVDDDQLAPTESVDLEAHEPPMPASEDERPELRSVPGTESASHSSEEQQVSGGLCALQDLGRLVVQLAASDAPARLDQQVGDARRILWFADGAIVGAHSTLAAESLLERARRDGLIDARQEAELRGLRSADAAEVLDRLRARGYVREREVVPLVQRHVEQIALEALAEPESIVAVVANEAPPQDLPVAMVPRPPIQLVVEALRHAADPSERLTAWGGLAAAPRAIVAEQLDGAFPLAPREARLLARIDGETSVEDLLFAAGMRQESALKLLAAYEALGWIEVRPVAAPRERMEERVTLDLDRLEAKFRQIQEADYFEILGLDRSASGDDVRRAWTVLAEEFLPLKYAGHPDPKVIHRARQVHDALSEAAQVLADDRLRGGYARSLAD